MTEKTLYPATDPYQRGRLKVSAIHEIYYETSGNPDGIPVVVCHGGPGGGSTPSMRRYFDPRQYRIILFDQRGCGRSTPHAELRENTTWHLVEDMEALRRHLGVDQWVVFGGSWGSTLALAYALTHRAPALALVLRGIFTLRQSELDWFYQEGGASCIFPDAWEGFVRPIPPAEREDLVGAYYERLTGDDHKLRVEAAKAWSVWEGTTVSLMPSPERVASFAGEQFAIAFARIESHFFVNHGFFEHDGWIINEAPSLAGLPGVIVQGRYDVVTPVQTAWELKGKWPDAELKIVPDAGHAASERGIVSALVDATDKFALRFA